MSRERTNIYLLFFDAKCFKFVVVHTPRLILSNLYIVKRKLFFTIYSIPEKLEMVEFIEEYALLE